MKLVYTHPSHVVVTQAQASLLQAGIECVIRNEYAAGAIGELAPIDAWPELWVIKDADFDRARSAVETLQADTVEADWNCPDCDTPNPCTFEFCWSCGRENG